MQTKVSPLASFPRYSIGSFRFNVSVMVSKSYRVYIDSVLPILPASPRSSRLTICSGKIKKMLSLFISSDLQFNSFLQRSKSIKTLKYYDSDHKQTKKKFYHISIMVTRQIQCCLIFDFDFLCCSLYFQKSKSHIRMEYEQTQTPIDTEQNRFNFIPVEFTAIKMQPMNDMERHLVGKIREMRGTKGMECRICLEDNEEESKLIVPCKCTGSVEATHEHCLKEWIKRRVEQYPKKRACCEVCNTEFNYTLANRRTFDCNQLTKHYNKDKKSIICFFSIYGTFLLLFISLIILTGLANSSDIFMTKLLNSGGGTTIIISILIIYFLALAVIGVLFISDYLVREDVVISQALSYCEPKSFIKNYKIYFKR